MPGLASWPPVQLPASRHPSTDLSLQCLGQIAPPPGSLYRPGSNQDTEPHELFQQSKVKEVFHSIPISMAMIRRTENKCWQRCREIRTLVCCRWGCKQCSHYRRCYDAPQKIKQRITVWSSKFPSGCILQRKQRLEQISAHLRS